MRLYILPFLLIASFSLSAQVTPDSLLRQTEVGQQVLTQKDTFDLRIQRAQNHLDSLRSLSQSKVDSSRIGRYLRRQQDSLDRQITRWQVKKDSLLSPIDTLQQKL